MYIYRLCVRRWVVVLPPICVKLGCFAVCCFVADLVCQSVAFVNEQPEFYMIWCTGLQCSCAAPNFNLHSHCVQSVEINCVSYGDHIDAKRIGILAFVIGNHGTHTRATRAMQYFSHHNFLLAAIFLFWPPQADTMASIQFKLWPTFVHWRD